MDLELNISQRPALSQDLVLSAEILRMSSAELNEYLKELSEENPVVEYEPPAMEDEPRLLERKLEWLESSDRQNIQYYDDDTDDTLSNICSPSSDETLEDHLLGQIRTQKLDPKVSLAAEIAVKSLDKNGYLAETAEGIAHLSGTEISDAERAIELIHSLDPAGSGARDLMECLLLQLAREDVPDKTAEAVVRSHLGDLAQNHIKQISSALGVSLSEAARAVKKVRSLNPRPSRGFASGESPAYIVPDAVIRRTSSGEYEAELNDRYYSSLKISGYYKDIVNSAADRAAVKYVGAKLRQAKWVLSCIEKRNSTLISVIGVITDRQRDFFDNGPSRLSPLKLSDVSSCIGMHESTVSRAVRDKYIQCGWGVFPLSYFFSSSVASERKKAVSQNSVKLRIRDIINSEDKKHPLSDRAIAEALEREGVSVSRRTVAKYRESMGIGGANMRKDF